MSIPPVLIGLVVALVIYAVATGVQRLVSDHRRTTTPTAEEWDGWVVAVVATRRVLTGEYSSGQRATVIARRADTGAEEEVWQGEPESLPPRIADQVFQGLPGQRSGPWFTTAGREGFTAFNLPTSRERKEAWRRARHGGYRMTLPQPVPVHVRRDVKGRAWWDITG